jgi:hypothetical protein
VSPLIVDHPGVGAALRLQGLTSGPDTEKPAGACLDYLETREDVDAMRIGIIALSPGGYYAPQVRRHAGGRQADEPGTCCAEHHLPLAGGARRKRPPDSPVARERTVAAAVNSKDRELKVFSLQDGGAEHCGADNSTMVVDYMADWVAERLGAAVTGI